MTILFGSDTELKEIAHELHSALLRCLREIEPRHIPGDVYQQAQRAIEAAGPEGYEKVRIHRGNVV
jgi:hypothetical protein